MQSSFKSIGARALLVSLLAASVSMAYATGSHNPPTGSNGSTGQTGGGGGGGGGGGVGVGLGIGQGGEGGTGTGIGTGTAAAAATGTATGTAVGGDQQQQQQQRQGFVGSNEANLGASTDASQAVRQEAVGAGNTTTVGGSSSSYNARALVIPAIIPGTPMTIVPSANITSVSDDCGPLQQIIRTPVTSTFNGIIWDSTRDAGWTEDLAEYWHINGQPVPPGTPFAQPMVYRMIDGQPYGHKVLYSTSVNTQGGARHIALGGGGGSNQGWAQGGAGASGADQRQFTTIQLRLCALKVTPTTVNYYNTYNSTSTTLPTVKRNDQ